MIFYIFFFRPIVLIIQDAIFESNFMLATVDFEGNTQSTSAPSLLISKLNTSQAQNLSQQDKEALENINWDKDFNEKEDEVLIIPNSPESPRTKKMKFTFQRCFEPTFHESQFTGKLVGDDSDTES